MKVDLIKLEELFCDQSSKTKESKQSCAAINLSATEFAKCLAVTLDNPADLTVCLRELKALVGMAHTSIVHKEKGVTYRDIFE